MSEWKNEWIEVDGNELDGSYTVSEGDVTNSISVGAGNFSDTSLYVSVSDLSAGNAEIGIEVKKPDGDWIDYHLDKTITIDTEDEAFPLLFESSIPYMRLTFDTLATDSTVTAFVARRRGK